MPQKKSVFLVYFFAFVQGLTMVSFPASSSVFQDVNGLSEQQYGGIFIPEVVATLLGSLVGASVVPIWGLHRLLMTATLANAGSLLTLGITAGLHSTWAFVCLSVSTTLYGFGFGLGSASMNTYPRLFFRSAPEVGLVALHTVASFGLAIGPLFIGFLIQHHQWVLFSVILLATQSILAIGIAGDRQLLLSPSEPGNSIGNRVDETGVFMTGSFWMMAGIVVFYAFAEGTFANWTILYLCKERHLGLKDASLTLSLFWTSLAVTRLLITALLFRIPSYWIWLLLPAIMTAAFFLISRATTRHEALIAWSVAGIGCSAVFPISVSLISRSFPEQSAWVSSLMVAFLMVGIGIGTWLGSWLREYHPFERIYGYSALYSISMFLLALCWIKTMRATAS